MKEKKLILLVNFGGPRSLTEVTPFLQELLCDQEMIRTRLWPFMHRLLFKRAATKRAQEVMPDYAKIGGKSPIYEDTEAIAQLLREKLRQPVLTFHRYLPATHPDFLAQLSTWDPEEIEVFPLFPQFSYATTGSCARWLMQYAPSHLVQRMRWLHSYASHPEYVTAQKKLIREFMEEKEISEEKALFLFSAHGLPQHFICTGDVYQSECIRSFEAISSEFPKARHLLAYQSKFGKGEWLRPYTNEVCETIEAYQRKQVLFVPLSFPSDHIETLFEIEELYLPIVYSRGLMAWRLPALNKRSYWIEAIISILRSAQPRLGNAMLVRNRNSFPRLLNCRCNTHFK